MQKQIAKHDQRKSSGNISVDFQSKRVDIYSMKSFAIFFGFLKPLLVGLSAEVALNKLKINKNFKINIY
ncbi:hypothetical protein BD408DRAFT_424047 [Parasitella parasitica]|nr:hypothetical protein BD408DRAFT_424047 [Parasitella parasitica]